MIYFIDGSKEAFLTAFLLAYGEEEPCITSQQAQLTLGQESVFVRANNTNAERAEKRLLKFDKHSMEDLDLILRSSSSRKEKIAFSYLKLLSERKESIKNMTEAAVIDALSCIRKVTFEVERLCGCIRFLDTDSGVPYAPLSPENDAALLLAQKLLARVPAFVLHDVRRKKAAVFDGVNLFEAPLEKAETALSAPQSRWTALWNRSYPGVLFPVLNMDRPVPVRKGKQA